MPASNFSRREAVLAFYRDELRARYAPEHAQQFDEMRAIPAEDLEALRDYFLDHVYPPPSEREHLDAAFDRLADMFRSPRRLQPLLSTAWSSLWKLGRQIPAAVSAGRNTLDAYWQTRRIEEVLVSNAEEIGLTEEDTHDRGQMLRLVAAVPERDVKRLIEDVLGLFKTFANRKLLDSTVEIMEASLAAMEKRRDIYSEDEVAGLTLGLGIVSGGRTLYEQVGGEVFPHLVEGVRQVENDWYQQAMQEAAAAAKKSA